MSSSRTGSSRIGPGFQSVGCLSRGLVAVPGGRHGFGGPRGIAKGWLDSPFFLDFMADILAITQQAMLGLDMELVDVERAPMGLLRVTIDRPEGVRIEDCEQVSKQLSRVFEVENIDYNRLEVGSPGVDRPLKQPADFIRFAGERVEIKLREAVDNRKVYAGVLRVNEGAADASAAPVFGLELESPSGEGQVLNFSFDDVDRAKLN